MRSKRESVDFGVRAQYSWQLKALQSGGLSIGLNFLLLHYERQVYDLYLSTNNDPPRLALIPTLSHLPLLHIAPNVCSIPDSSLLSNNKERTESHRGLEPGVL